MVSGRFVSQRALAAIVGLACVFACSKPTDAPPDPASAQAPAALALPLPLSVEAVMDGAGNGAAADAVPASPRPLLTNVVYEVQGPANGGPGSAQYYLASTTVLSGSRRELSGYAGGTGGVTDGRVDWGSSSFGARAERANPAQEPATTWRRAGAEPNGSVLKVGEREELPLVAARAAVWIEGHRARVVLDWFYANDTERTLEGTFKLRLPDGASPYYLAFGGSALAADAGPLAPPKLAPQRELEALGHEPVALWADRADTWIDTMIDPREARMVPRVKAARAYRDTVRRQVDPALLEWSGAGVFSARVFPLTPLAQHRIVVAYEMDLVPIDGELEYALELPESVPLQSVDVQVAAAPSARVTVTPGADDVLALGPGRARHAWVAPEARSFHVRVAGAPLTALVTPPSADDGEFALALRPELAARPTAGATRAVFLVDTSLGSASSSLPIWLDLLREVLERNREALSEFAVLFFDVQRHWWREGFVPNTPANVDAAIEHARRIALEGATDLDAALREAARPAWAEGAPAWLVWDAFLLSDGAATWGPREPSELAAALRDGRAGALFAYRTGLAGTDGPALEHLARESGGGVISVAGESELAAAAVAHRARPWRLERVSVAGAHDVLVAGRPRHVFPGQRLVLAGRGRPRAGDAVELVLTQSGESTTVRATIDTALESPLAARAYGEIAVAQLEELGARDDDVARSFATHYRVTGRTCSLLMLETEEDYERHGIDATADAALVRATEVGSYVGAALDDVGRALADPRAAFLARLDRLAQSEQRPLPEDVRAALASAPREAFGLVARPLACAPWPVADEDAAMRAGLVEGRPDGALVDAAVTRRAEELGRPDDALRLLSSLVEGAPSEEAILTGVGLRAIELGFPGHAYHLFARLADARPGRLHPYRHAARCAAALEKPALAIAWYELALAGTAGDVRRIVAFEYARALDELRARELPPQLASLADRRAKGLGRELGDVLGADLVVVVSWSTDATDVDLHVHEPDGGHCFYGNRRTKSGGSLTRDVTGGWGPEMYVLPRAPRGEYTVSVHYFGDDANRASLDTLVGATVYERPGTPSEVVRAGTIRLAERSQTVRFAALRLGALEE